MLRHPYPVRLQVIAISDGVAYYVVLGLHCGPKTTILILILTLQFMALHAIIFILELRIIEPRVFTDEL